jgi:hypothetical protein
MNTSNGINESGSSAGYEAKYENTMNAVAFVGPNTVCRDDASKGPTIAATAEHVIP